MLWKSRTECFDAITKQSLLAADHAAQITPAEDVDMKVENLLMGVGSVVGEKAVAGPDQAQLARRRRDRAEEAGDLGFARALSEIVHVDVSAFRDHQHVHRRLRPDVVKGERG